jgi:hypothetical protein
MLNESKDASDGYDDELTLLMMVGPTRGSEGDGKKDKLYSSLSTQSFRFWPPVPGKMFGPFSPPSLRLNLDESIRFVPICRPISATGLPPLYSTSSGSRLVASDAVST